jgi:hypothetical protein
MDFSALDDSLAAPASAVFAGIGQHNALPQRSSQNGLSFPDGKGLAAGDDADFKLLHEKFSKNGRPLSLIATFSAVKLLYRKAGPRDRL